MKQIEGGVTSAKGFMAAGVAAGIKYKDRKDMALVYSEKEAAVAGVFTQNVVKAEPVIWDKMIVDTQKKAQAVVLNSGIANACTGELGKELNVCMADSVARELKISTNLVCTASTGVIGMQLKEEPLKEGAKKLVKALKHSTEAGLSAAEAIMTTDTISKQCAASFMVGEQEVTIGGMSKGSGMIHPNMATMLSVVTTDAVIDQALLQEILSEDVKASFNMISVDRDTSTNDTLLVLANGLAENEPIVKGTKAYTDFCEALAFITKSLAKMMAGDGEGATKLLEVTVNHCDTKENAVTLSKSVITSNLVKAAMYGSDANWGRILCALGYAGVNFDPAVIDLTIQTQLGKLVIVKDGVATDYSEDEATKLLSEKSVTVICDMKMGNETATAWGCDLTHDYVTINGDYRS